MIVEDSSADLKNRSAAINNQTRLNLGRLSPAGILVSSDGGVLPFPLTRRRRPRPPSLRAFSRRHKIPGDGRRLRRTNIKEAAVGSSLGDAQFETPLLLSDELPPLTARPPCRLFPPLASAGRPSRRRARRYFLSERDAANLPGDMKPGGNCTSGAIRHKDFARLSSVFL